MKNTDPEPFRRVFQKVLAQQWPLPVFLSLLCLLGAFHPLDQCLLSCAINAYGAVNQPLHSLVIIVCLPLDQRLSDT